MKLRPNTPLVNIINTEEEDKINKDIIVTAKNSKNTNDYVLRNFSNFMHQIIDNQNDDFLSGKKNVVKYILAKYLQISESELSSMKKLSILITNDYGLLNQFSLFLPELIILKLNNSNILSFNDIGSNFTKIKCLQMQHCHLKNLNGIICLQQLEIFDIEDNDIDDATDIEMCSELKKLNMAKNKISNFDNIIFISSIEQLNYISLLDNPICKDEQNVKDIHNKLIEVNTVIITQKDCRLIKDIVKDYDNDKYYENTNSKVSENKENYFFKNLYDYNNLQNLNTYKPKICEKGQEKYNVFLNADVNKKNNNDKDKESITNLKNEKLMDDIDNILNEDDNNNDKKSEEENNNDNSKKTFFNHSSNNNNNPNKNKDKKPQQHFFLNSRPCRHTKNNDSNNNSIINSDLKLSHNTTKDLEREIALELEKEKENLKKQKERQNTYSEDELDEDEEEEKRRLKEEEDEEEKEKKRIELQRKKELEKQREEQLEFEREMELERQKVKEEEEKLLKEKEEQELLEQKELEKQKEIEKEKEAFSKTQGRRFNFNNNFVIHCDIDMNEENNKLHKNKDNNDKNENNIIQNEEKNKIENKKNNNKRNSNFENYMQKEKEINKIFGSVNNNNKKSNTRQSTKSKILIDASASNTIYNKDKTNHFNRSTMNFNKNTSLKKDNKLLKSTGLLKTSIPKQNHLANSIINNNNNHEEDIKVNSKNENNDNDNEVDYASESKKLRDNLFAIDNHTKKDSIKSLLNSLDAKIKNNKVKKGSTNNQSLTPLINTNNKLVVNTKKKINFLKK